MIVTRHGEIGSRAMRQYNTYVYIYYKKEHIITTELEGLQINRNQNFNYLRLHYNLI